MSSIAAQSITELGGPASVLVRQKVDHERLDELLQRLARVSPSEERAVLRDLYRLVFPHAFAEEAVLWPLMRRVLPDGEELTLRVEEEHQEVNELVTRLDSLEPGSPERDAALDRLAAVLREDVRDEEDELLPRLQERVAARRLRQLGAAWELVRRIAPTRAHPVVARRPPGNVLAALPLSAIDRTRDRLDALESTGPTRVAGLLGRTSRGLGRMARGVERLPWMTAGERESTSVASPSSSVAMTAGAIVAAAIYAVGITAITVVAVRRA